LYWFLSTALNSLWINIKLPPWDFLSKVVGSNNDKIIFCHIYFYFFMSHFVKLDHNVFSKNKSGPQKPWKQWNYIKIADSVWCVITWKLQTSFNYYMKIEDSLWLLHEHCTFLLWFLHENCRISLIFSWKLQTQFDFSWKLQTPFDFYMKISRISLIESVYAR
jgi:hypothetical protein